MLQSFCRAGLLLALVSNAVGSAVAADAERGIESLLEGLRPNHVKLANNLEKRWKQSQREVEQFKKGHVIFGRIQLTDGGDARAVVSQMIVLDDGYFVDAIGEAGKPIGFRLHGYESVDVTPKGPGPIEDLGVIVMKPLSLERLASVNGRVGIESNPNGPRMEQVQASLRIVADPINTPHNGTEGISRQQSTVAVEIAADGTFQTQGMSSGKYLLVVKAPNCVQQLIDVEVAEGNAKELEPIRLELVRKVNVEFAVSAEGDFGGAKFEKTSLKADDRWRASQDVPEYGFDLLVTQKEGMLQFAYRYGPCHIKDLGVAALTDELEVDMQDLQNQQPQNVLIEDGHVYVVLQSHWKHWILLRTTTPEMDR